MPTYTAGSGLGIYGAVVRRKEYAVGAFGTPTRTLYLKTFKPTWDPHIVQGGPYLGYGRIADIGSAHVKMGTDAKATLTGDVMTSAQALLLASAFGCDPTLKQVGTTTAYELFHTPPGGSLEAGVVLEAPESHDAEKKSAFLDLQLGIPYTNAELNAQNYKAGVVTKAEFVFDRMALCSYSYDIDFRAVEPSGGSLIVPSATVAGVPFAMNEGSSAFKIGTPGSASALQGVRKMTVTLEHKMATDRWYLGEAEKGLPVSNALVDITMSVEADYTESAKNVFEAFLKNEAKEIIAEAFGAEIGTSGKKNTFTFKMPNIFINAGAEPPITGPDIIKPTMTAKATINAANEAVVSATLITADSTL
jgi:hypothetical protein